MKELILRDLTEYEHEKLDSFIANENTELYQYFLGIITSDLIPIGEIAWKKALELISGEHTKEPPFNICGVIDAWVRLCMEYKDYGLVGLIDLKEVKGLKKSIEAVVYGFSNCIYYDGNIGTSGKKQNDLENNYTQMVMQGITWWQNEKVHVEPELMYRFVMSEVEDLGFRVVAKSDNSRKIDLEIYKGIGF